MKLDKKDILHIVVIIIGIIFLAIPIFHNNLWFDESYSVAISNHTFKEIWEIGSNDVHPVLYYWVLHILNLIFGSNIIVYRIFSCICASLVGIIGFTHIKKDFGKNVGILFSFFSMFLPVITVYAGEIRMYTFAMLLVTLMCIYAYRIYKNGEKKQIKNWVLFAMFSLSSAYTHYYGLMAAGIVNIIMFTYVIGKMWKNRKVIYELKVFIILAITQIILYIPWILSLLLQMKQVSKGFWISIAFPDTIIEFFKFQFTGNLGGTQYIPNIYAIILGIIISTYIICIFVKNRISKKKIEEEKLPIKLSLIIYIGVIIGACVVSIVMQMPIIYARYMLCVTGIFIFILSYYIGKNGNKYITSIICILCIIAGINIQINLCKDNYDISNSKPYKYLQANVEENDILLCQNELSGFVTFTNFPNNKSYFYDAEKWNVEKAYKAFGNKMETIYNLEEIENLQGRIWVLDSSDYKLLEKIKERYSVKIIDQKTYNTKYHSFTYSFSLIEK